MRFNEPRISRLLFSSVVLYASHNRSPAAFVPRDLYSGVFLFIDVLYKSLSPVLYRMVEILDDRRIRRTSDKNCHREIGFFYLSTLLYFVRRDTVVGAE